MKTIVLLMLGLLVPAGTYAAPQDAGPKTENDKTFYTLGAAIGQNLSVFNLTPSELQFVTLGLKDQVKGSALRVDTKTYAPKIESIAKARQAVKAEAEKKQSEIFLQKMLKEKGAVRSDSGLIIITIKEGTGTSPKATSRVKVHYHGTLTNGEVFDSSVQRGTPSEFVLNEVIPCWTEGVQKMKVGSKAKLICPSKIAYGDRGSPPVIPGGATLVFEVELLDILK